MTRARAGGGQLAARFVFVDPAHVLAPGEIVWDPRGRIVALRRARSPRIADVGVFPGLVNAHAHLQIGALARRERRFVPWLGAVMAARASTSPARERVATRAAIAELLAGGTAVVGDIDSSGAGAAVLARSPLRFRSYRELTGFHLDERGAVALVRERMRARAGSDAGLSPHAPYSVSGALFRAAAAACRFLAVHCAEVEAEQQFLHTGRGPFRELLERLGRLPADHRAPGVGAVRWLAQLGVLRRGTQLVHCQELERGDVARIAAAGASIAVCPGTIAWFRRTPPDVARWLRAGIAVALGTDSRASNAEWSMRAELRRAAALWPALAPATLLAMATVHGARSLGVRGAGSLRRHGGADFLVVDARPTPVATLAAFVHGELALRRVVCGGRDVATDSGR